MTIFEILGVFRIDKATGLAALKELNVSGETAAKKLSDGFQKAGDSIARYVKIGAAAAVAAVGAYAVSAVKAFADVDAVMTTTFAEMGAVSEATKEKLTATAKAISEAYNISMLKVAEGMHKAFDLGATEENIDDFLGTAAQLARVAGVDLNTAVASLGKTVQLTGGDFSKATEYANILWKAAESGDTDLQSLSTQLARVAPLAASMGISFKTVAALLATMSQQGIPARTALSGIQGLFEELGDSTSDVAVLFTDLTEMTFPDFIEQGGTLADVLAILASYADESGISIEALFTATTTGNAALALTGEHVEALTKNLKDQEEQVVTLGTVWGEMSTTLKEQISSLKTWWDNTKIEIGGEIAADLQGLLDYLSANKDEIRDTLASLASGLISALTWLIEHKTAVVAALTVVAVGMAAILAVTHPLIAGLLAVGVAVAALASLFSDTTAMRTYKKEMEKAAKTAEIMAEATKASGQSLVDMRIYAIDAAKYFGTDKMREALKITGEALAGITKQLYDQLDAMAAAGKISAEEVAVLYREIDMASLASVFEPTAEAAQARILSYVEVIKNAYGIQIPAALTLTAQAMQVESTSIEDLGQREMEMTDAYIKQQTALEKLTWARKAAGEVADAYAWEDLAAAIDKPTTALSSFARVLGTAFDGLSSGDLAVAEATLWLLGESVDELRKNAEALASSQGLKESSDEYKKFVDDYVTQNSTLVEDAVATRDEIVASWEDFASEMGSAFNGFLDEVSTMVTTNRDLAKEHKDTLVQIEKDYGQSEIGFTKTHETARQEAIANYEADLAELQQQKADGLLTEEQYQTKLRELNRSNVDELKKIEDEYTTAKETATTTRTDAIDTETTAYEEAQVTWGEILKEMATNLLIELRNELALQAAKHLAMAVADAILLNFVGAAQELGAAAALGVGAAGLALAGFKQGGIATEEMVARIGDTGVNEAVIPLTATNLGSIGAGIAAASVVGGSTTSIGGASFVVNVNNPTVRSDADIRQIVTGVNDALKRWERGQGRLVPVGV